MVVKTGCVIDKKDMRVSKKDHENGCNINEKKEKKTNKHVYLIMKTLII